MSDSALLAEINERTKNIEATVNRLDKTVFTGNGQPPMTERMGALESRFESFLVQCERCQAVVFQPARDDDSSLAEAIVTGATEVKKIDATTRQIALSKRWEFWALIGASVAGWMTTILHIIATAALTVPKP